MKGHPSSPTGTPNATAWVASYELARRGLDRTLDGISDPEALIVPQSGCNCVNWLVGHILLYRNRIHEVLGLEPAWPERLGSSEPYERGSSSSSGALTIPLGELRSALERSERIVLERLAVLEPAELAAMATATRTVGEQLALFGAHDFYHLGQLGMVRRLLGKPAALG
jgi:uncharacterized damage-inducible protein DinB